jgi:hypothetical protein
MAVPSATGHEEIFVPLPAPIGRIHPPKSIRSTLIASSLRAIRERALFDAYLANLDDVWRDIPTRAIAGTWLPIAAALAHYTSCDRLGFTVHEQIAIGREVGDRIHGTFLGTMIRGAKNAGVTPWVALAQTERLYERLFDGGACSVTKVGPKDARVELVANPCLAIPYFRNAMRGLWAVALEFFCEKAYITEIGRSATSYRVRAAWA